MENKKKVKREEYNVRIDPSLYNILSKIKDKINKYAYNCLKVSDYEAGKILAEKIKENKLIE